MDVEAKIRYLMEELDHLKSEVHDLRELSTPRDILMDKVADKTEPMIVHLAKIYLFQGDSALVDYWRGEMISFLNRVPKMRSTKKYPTKDELADWMWDDSRREGIEGFFDDAIGSERNTTPRTDADEGKFARMVGIYVDKLAGRLSERGYVTGADLRGYLDAAGFVYDPSVSNPPR